MKGTKMDSYKFQKACKEWLVKYYKEKFEKDISIEDIYVVWSCKTLQNNKVLIATNRSDNLYIECTYNGNKEETYFDVYRKEVNILVDNEELIK